MGTGVVVIRGVVPTGVVGRTGVVVGTGVVVRIGVVDGTGLVVGTGVVVIRGVVADRPGMTMAIMKKTAIFMAAQFELAAGWSSPKEVTAKRRHGVM